MSLINRQIDSLYNGVSQQPASVRLPSQCEAMINSWQTLVQGVMKRPPTQHVAVVSDIPLANAKTILVNRDINTQYYIVISAGNIQVFDLNGTQYSVSFPYGTGYLQQYGLPIETWAASINPTGFRGFVRPTTPNGAVYTIVSSTGNGGTTEPAWSAPIGSTVQDGGLVWKAWVDPVSSPLVPTTAFNAVSIADYTFIVNKTVTVGMLAAGADQSAQPTGYYSLTTNQLKGNQLSNYSAAYGGLQAQYDPNPSGGTLKGTVQTFDDLPGNPGGTDPNGTPSEGDIYEIDGDDTSGFTAYYVVYTGGVWNETVAPGIQNQIDPETMPWALVRNGDGTFTFAPFSWAPRRVGDETTNPNPSFVGNTFNDVSMFQDRLNLLSGENTTWSRVGDYGNYYRMTVVQLLADEVVDIASSDNQVTVHNFAVPFATGMMTFCDQAQYRVVIPSGGELTPTTVGLNVATRYVASSTVRPLLLGTDIFFISEDDQYAHLRDYYVQLNYLSQFQVVADDVTAHVPYYIPKGVYLMTGSNLHDVVFCVTSPFPNRVYVYKYNGAGAANGLTQQTRNQEAWGYWDFGPDTYLYGMDTVNDSVYFLIGRAGGIMLEKMDVAIGANVGMPDVNGKPYDLFLDRRVSGLTGTVAGSPTNTTTFLLPYDPEQTNFLMVNGAGSAAPGSILDPSTYTFPEANQVTVPGAITTPVFAGELFNFSYQFSEQFMMNRNNVAILSGRLTLRNWRIKYNGTVIFTSTVDPYGNGNPSALTYLPNDAAAYEGITAGLGSLIAGGPVVCTGTYEFGAFCQSSEGLITLSDASPYPVCFSSAEWEADYTNRSQTA